VAFSGGKDSTALLQLIWLSLRTMPRHELAKPVHVCYVDTGMEHPAYDRIVRATLRSVAAAAEVEGLPVHVRTLEPELDHRYFVCVIGRGYAPPTHWFRWCTRNLRIKPMSAFIRSQVSRTGAVVVALGLRRSESQSRLRILSKYNHGHREFMGAYGSVPGAIAFTPIEDFKTEHVWQFLMQTACPWGGKNRELVQLYADAAGGECPSYSLGNSLSPSCGGSRFGCWTCTVVRKDRTGRALAEQNESFELLSEFRDWLASMRSDPKRRWKRRRNGAPGPGPLTIATRRDALRRVMALEARLGVELVRSDELQRIAELWLADGGDGHSVLTYRSSRAELKLSHPDA
jgi:DNA sulfur modification protein DndC